MPEVHPSANTSWRLPKGIQPWMSTATEKVCGQLSTEWRVTTYTQNHCLNQSLAIYSLMAYHSLDQPSYILRYDNTSLCQVHCMLNGLSLQPVFGSITDTLLSHDPTFPLWSTSIDVLLIYLCTSFDVIILPLVRSLVGRVDDPQSSVDQRERACCVGTSRHHLRKTGLRQLSIDRKVVCIWV